MKGDIRHTYAWRKIRAYVLSKSEACFYCKQALCPDAPPRSPMSSSVDHRVPVDWLKHLDTETIRGIALDPSTLVAAHLKCNSSRGNGRRARKQQRKHYTGVVTNKSGAWT